MRLFLYMLGICIVLAIASAIGLVIYAWDYYEGAGSLTQPKTVIFNRGEGFKQMADTLAAEGVIDHPLIFKGIAAALGTARKFKAGEYAFTPGMTPHAIMRMIAAGKVVVHKVTVPEGLTVADIVRILQSEPALDGEVPKGIKEGTLLPETYQFLRGDKREDIVKRMQADMKTLIDSLWARRKDNLPFTTQEQGVVLASIVEKETGIAKERGHVASVFINRLRKGMKLQSDPTVAYGMEQAMGAALGRPLTSEDLRTPTPYNTYMIDGLPPAPIANPGKAALEAAFNPPETDDLYFVATGNGGHHFAATLDEHNRNVLAYRRKLVGQ